MDKILAVFLILLILTIFGMIFNAMVCYLINRPATPHYCCKTVFQLFGQSHETEIFKEQNSFKKSRALRRGTRHVGASDSFLASNWLRITLA